MADHTKEVDELPEDHLMNGIDADPNDVEGMMNALGERMLNQDTEDINGFMLIIDSERATDTIPALDGDIDTAKAIFRMIGTHIDHIADAGRMSREEVAAMAIRSVQDMESDAYYQDLGTEVDIE